MLIANIYGINPPNRLGGSRCTRFLYSLSHSLYIRWLKSLYIPLGEGSMKKAWFVLMALVVFGGFFLTTGEAAQLCWQVDFPTNTDFNGYVSVKASGGKWTRAVHL